jgi:predicted O-methyltransferase YrrM
MSLVRVLKKIARKTPYLRQVLQERDRLRDAVDALGHPPGHYYSPIPSAEDMRAANRTPGKREEKGIPGLDLNEKGQLELLDRLQDYYHELPFSATKQPGLRYYYSNDFYSYSDGVFLYSMLRHLQPARVIEIGSGFSSSLMLDTNERFLGNQVRCTFIDPEPTNLRSLLKDEDAERVTIIPKRIQDIDPGIVSELAANDLLFVDSSHVSKAGSDLNLILFEILPRLAKGVYIHFHDVFWPFEYPEAYFDRGWAWNEAYLLRAFLMYNREFQIALFGPFLTQFHGDRLAREMPLTMAHPPSWPTLCGASIWLRRV